MNKRIAKKRDKQLREWFAAGWKRVENGWDWDHGIVWPDNPGDSASSSPTPTPHPETDKRN